MKKITYSVFLLLFCLAAAGCTQGSYTVIMGNENNTGDTMSMEYEKFNGEKQMGVDVPAGQSCELQATVETLGGRIDFAVLNKDKEVVYQQADLPTGTFEVSLPGPSFYTLHWQAANHQGSYKVVYRLQEQAEAMDDSER